MHDFAHRAQTWIIKFERPLHHLEGAEMTPVPEFPLFHIKRDLVWLGLMRT
jgi:hypothetical protein